MSTTTTPTTDATAMCIESMQLMVSGTLADFQRVIHPDAVNRESRHEPPACRVPGPVGFHETARWLRSTFAELRFDVHATVADGDLVVVHNTMAGRQTGPMVGYTDDGSVADAFPARGRHFATAQTHWFRLADGLIVEHWANRDDIGTAQQLGWIPPSPAYLVRMALAKRRARRAQP